MAQAVQITGYHDAATQWLWSGLASGHTDTKFTYDFENFFHPFVGELIAKLNRDSLPGVMDATWQQSLSQQFFETYYALISSSTVEVDYHPKEIDVSVDGPYANYNWELFFHIPVTIAVHLSKTQRFAEAQHWFHYVFDPTCNDQSYDPPKRFWKFLAFRQDPDPKQIDYLLALMSQSPAGLSSDDLRRQRETLAGYAAILAHPFQPHAVAQTRPIAYQYYVFMKYVDNLIAWGDNLFQQDTIETINEATQRYVLAANLLGPKPEQIPSQGNVQPKTYAQIRALTQDPMGNALVDLEGQFPFNLTPGASGSSAADGSQPLFGIGRTFYFCVARNDKLLAYWDIVADRLFKIRNCMNIAGIVRPLALFDPPIDPGMLIKAAAAGIDISSIVNGLNQPVGPLRALPLIQKTLELCAEVRSLGGALLAALEKGDGEHLALIRQKHEIQIQQMTQNVRFLQWKSAQEATTSLLTSRATALERFHYYQRLLGLPADANAPDSLTLDRRELNEDNFDDAYAALVGQFDKAITLQNYPALKLAGSSSPAQQSGASGPGSLYLNTNEDTELNTQLPTARDTRLAASVAETVGSVLTFIPEFNINLHFWGMGGSSKVFGGSKMADAARITAEVLRTIATWNQDQAGMSARTAGHQRRADEWLLQYNLAGHELMQLGRQILTSLIAEQTTYHDYVLVQQQIANSQEVDQYLHDKFTNEELHLWMQGEISRLYYEYYRFAFDTARKAERTMKQELMRPELDAQTFVQFNYWDGGRKGLLSGEALHLDVKRMEMAYHDSNQRELELTRHVSLRQLAPLALLKLKATGNCTVDIPEWLYDRDRPGLYLRRIKSVALSIPSVVGPYTGVHCTLSLTKSSIRTSPISGDDYTRQGTDDERFMDYAGAIQSIVTSSAVNDSGLFETNLREDRFLPFEGAGAISTWQLDLPTDYPSFDYATISDVILHIRYTARQGAIEKDVTDALDTLFADVASSNLALLFNLRYDFPTEWSAFANGAQDLSLTIRKDYFPYVAQGKPITVNEIAVYAQDGSTHHAVGDPAAATQSLADPAQQQFALTAPADTTGATKVLTRTPTAQVFLVLSYTLGA